MANRVNKEKAEKYLRSYKLHGRKTRAAQDAGDHRKNATRLHEAIARDPEGGESLADMQKERIDAFRQLGVSPTAWAKGLKMGMERAMLVACACTPKWSIWWGKTRQSGSLRL